MTVDANGATSLSSSYSSAEIDALAKEVELTEAAAPAEGGTFSATAIAIIAAGGVVVLAALAGGGYVLARRRRKPSFEASLSRSM